MKEIKLGARHKWPLLALMALQGEATNPELKKITGYTLVSPERQDLNDLELVTSHKPERKQYYAHVLTEKGWDWCAKELAGERPDRSGAAGGTVYAILGLFARFLKHRGMTLVEFCQQAGAITNGLEERVRIAYRKLATRPGKSVSLTDLRPLLPAVDRSEVDEMLQQMNRMQGVHLTQEPNQKALSQADRDAAVLLGGQYYHHLSIEDA